MAEERQVIHVPFAAGLNTKGDQRAEDAPFLSICKDAEFDSVGGLQTRKPYAALGVNILGGGTLSSVRKVFQNGDELCCFTVDTMYSWSARDSAWVNKGTHLAISTAEVDRFGDNMDQRDVDRAELGNTIVYAWTEGAGTDVYVAAVDKTTTSVICAPVKVQSSGGSSYQPRLVALQTKIVLFWITGAATIAAVAIDPANVATTATAAPTTILNTIGGTTVSAYYDVDRAPGTDTAIVVNGGATVVGYLVASVTSALVVVSARKARQSIGYVGVACHPDGLHFQIARMTLSGAVSHDLTGDYLAVAALADVNINQSLDVGLNHTAFLSRLAMAYRSVQDSGHYRCYIFFNDSDSATNIYSCWVDDNNTLGASAILISENVNIASRAFDYGGKVYFWTLFHETSVFTGGNSAGFRAQLQNTYFLHRDDGKFFAKAAAGPAGDLQSTVGSLPTVALTGGTTTFSWAATRKTIISLAALQTGLTTGRVPRDITFTFDSNDARRTARLGGTLYISGGEILCYDGTRIVECGYHTYPWSFPAVDQAAGSMAAGIYAYRMTWKYTNGAGEIDRSTTATVAQVTLGANRFVRIAAFGPLALTHKTASVPAAEVWRTAVAPTAGSPFYLVTSNNPNAGAGANTYLPSNVSAIFDDALPDASVIVLQSGPQNAGLLESLAPPPATIISATADRIFLAGVAGDLNRVWYSKLRVVGEVAAFNDALVISVPPAGGTITGLAFLNETLIVFRQRAIYAFPGDGFDNLGGGANYGPARILSLEVGATNQESIALTEGGLRFKSSRGWFVLNRGWGVEYFGEGVAAYDSETVLATHVVGGQQQMRVVTSNRIMIWDSYTKEWGEWTIAGALDAAVWNGTHYYLTSAGVFAQQTDFSSGTSYGMDVELSNVKPAGLVGRFNARWIMPLGEYRSSCLVRMRVGRNYRQDGSGNWEYFDDRVKTPVAVVGGPIQVRHGPSIQGGHEALKIRITAISATLALASFVNGPAGSTITITSRKPGTLGNAIVFANSVGGALKATDSGGTVTLSGPATVTYGQVVDVINRDSLLISAVLAGTSGTSFALSSFTGSPSGGVDWPTGEALKLTGVGLEIGAAPGLFKLLAQAQKG